MDPATWGHAELRERAREVLDPAVFAYVDQGSGDGVTAARAADAWRAITLAPRVLVDVRSVDLGTTVLGRPWSVPWGVAPTTLQRAVHRDGDVAMAAATREAGGVLVVSSNTGTAFDDIASTGVRWWLQLYLPRDRELARPLLEVARGAGAEAVVLTVDTPVVSAKRAPASQVWDVVPPRWVRANFTPDHDALPGAEKAADLGPDDLAWLRDASGLPVVVKGVLRADDARRCVAGGAAAIWVSNHGGRQLDRTVSSAAALPAIVDAVGSEVDVLVDGGLRSGLDVVTALALGARACFLGRTPLFALAVGGRDGVARLHQGLLGEAEEALRLAGAAHIGDLTGLVVAPDPR